MVVRVGTGGPDRLTGTAGTDTLRGLAGADTLVGSLGADLLDGGAGLDLVQYVGAAVGARLDGGVNFGAATGDVYVGVENLAGTGFNDTLAGSNGANLLQGGGGADRLFGFGGADTLEGGADGDLLDGGTGFDVASYLNETAGVGARLDGGANFGAAAGDTLRAVEGLFGSRFADSLVGSVGANLLFGGDGADRLFGLGGGDTLDGGGGVDVVSYAQAGAAVGVRLDGGANFGAATGDVIRNVEQAIGSAFDDALVGDAGANLLLGGAGNDRLFGQAGADLLEGGLGADRLDGGPGFDQASYAREGAAVAARLDGGVNAGAAAGDTLIGVEGLIGSVFDDTLIGFAGATLLQGGAGADRLFGLAGPDTLEGGGGADLLDGGDGFDLASWAGDAAAVGARLDGGVNFGAAAGDTLIGFEGLVGSAFNDRLVGDARANRLLGLAGGDLLFGFGGADTLDGGPGFDVANFAERTAAAVIRLNDNANAGAAAGTVLVSVEGVIATPFDDTVVGDAGADSLRGQLGNDRLFGLDGDDTLLGEDGGDRLDGGLGDDVLLGGAGADQLFGGPGADILGTGPGVDQLIGNAGADLFVIREVPGAAGATDADADVLRAFGYFEGDRIGLREALQGVSFTTLSEVVQIAQTPQGSMVRIDRDGTGGAEPFRDALLIENQTFSLAQLQNYGFDVAERADATMVQDPYGFANSSNTATDPAITPNAQYLVFVDKQNLDGAPDDVAPNGGNESSASMDVFLRAIGGGSTQRVSIDAAGGALRQPTGGPADAASPEISDDGRLVAFATDGRGVVRDANANGDVYIRDMFDAFSAPELVSIGPGGLAAGGVPIGSRDQSESPAVLAMSGDGTKIAFLSTSDITAPGAAPSDDNGALDVYLRDRVAGTTTLVSAIDNPASALDGDAGGAGATSTDALGAGIYGAGTIDMSADGRFVVFTAEAPLTAADSDTTVDVYVRDVARGRTLLVSGAAPGDALSPQISANGVRIMFVTDAALAADDDNGAFDVYAVDLNRNAFTLGAPRLISRATDGDALPNDSFNPAMAPNGQAVAFLTNNDVDTGFGDFNDNLVVYDLAADRYAAPRTPFFEEDGAGIASGAVAHALTTAGLAYRVAGASDGDSIRYAALDGAAFDFFG